MQNATFKNTAGKDYGRAIMSWSAPEFREVERGDAWALRGAIVAIMLVIFGIFTGNLPFAFIVLLISGLYYINYKQKPRRIEIALTTSGIKIGDVFCAYQNIQTFWILYHPEIHVKRLHINLKAGFLRNIECELEDQNPVEVRMLLSAHIPESENKTEELTDKISRLLRL